MKGAQGGSKGKESHCDQLCQPCAKNKMNSTTLSPGRRGALSSGHSLPTLCAFQGHHCGPSCNWVCVPTEFQANLGKHVKTWYENAGRGVEEREKECALPCKSCRALHSTFDPQCLLCGSLGSSPEGLCRNGYPTGHAHKCNTVGILCTWEECLLSMITERITITQLRIHDTGIVWGTLRNAASRQESMDCSLKAIRTTR